MHMIYAAYQVILNISFIAISLTKRIAIILCNLVLLRWHELYKRHQ